MHVFSVDLDVWNRNWTKPTKLSTVVFQKFNLITHFLKYCTGNVKTELLQQMPTKSRRIVGLNIYSNSIYRRTGTSNKKSGTTEIGEWQCKQKFSCNKWQVNELVGNSMSPTGFLRERTPEWKRKKVTFIFKSQARLQPGNSKDHDNLANYQKVYVARVLQYAIDAPSLLFSHSYEDYWKRMQLEKLNSEVLVKFNRKKLK